mgnify:CR=1 FL=1
MSMKVIDAPVMDADGDWAPLEMAGAPGHSRDFRPAVHIAMNDGRKDVAVRLASEPRIRAGKAHFTVSAPGATGDHAARLAAEAYGGIATVCGKPAMMYAAPTYYTPMATHYSSQKGQRKCPIN